MTNPTHKSGFVAVVGVPNAGKSTLMNQFLKQKIAIVSHRPQTTRTRQLGILTTDAYQIIFVDTPGLIKKAKHALDEAMVDTVVEAMGGADVILWLVDGTTPPSETDKEVAALATPLSKKLSVILAINKIDSASPDKLLAHSDAYRALLPDQPWLAFSAKTGAGCDMLLEMIIEALPEGPQFYPPDQVTDTFMRDIAAEMIREQLLLQLQDEIPHAAAIQIVQFKERDNGMIYVNAMIHVERDTHKKIIIGKDGAQIKRIGSAARKEIEQMLDTRVFIELRVKTTPKWRTNEKMIERFGYTQ